MPIWIKLLTLISHASMKLNALFPILIVIIAGFTSCSRKMITTQNPRANGSMQQHPAWSAQSNIYEVNLRQYSPQGTIKEFEKHLPRLKEMGVEILWFMPITPIGIKERKMTEQELGSYYSVRDYTALNTEFGTMEDWKEFVQHAHQMGFKVITDWVANHSSPDNRWVDDHPGFYERDANGNTVYDADWNDTRNLNYDSRELRDSMIAAMAYWVRVSDIDGFRCDVAEGVPEDFWRECIDTLKSIKDVFMLAEGEKPALHLAGFDETYAWTVMETMIKFQKGEKTLQQVDSVINYNIGRFPQNAYRLYFTTNHDWNSWEGTEFERYGDGYKTFAVFTQTMYQSVPLIYSGQEIPNRRRLKFFVRDPINWDQFGMAPFYNTLLHLREKNPALAATASYQKLKSANDDAIFAYVRENGKHKVAVILNFSSQPQNVTIAGNAVNGRGKDVFTDKTIDISANHIFSLEPWGYQVLTY